MEIDKNGNKRWYHNGVLHREDGPAVEREYEHNWYYNGQLHREGGPAIIYFSTGEKWYWHGVLHRNFGPAWDIPGERREYWNHGIERRPTLLEKLWNLCRTIKEIFKPPYVNNKLAPYKLGDIKPVFLPQPFNK